MSATPIDYQFPEYLAAKRTVDDRALNLGVWQSLCAAVGATQRGLKGEAGNATPRPLEVLELAAGIGTMIERSLHWRLFEPAPVRYTAIDAQRDNMAAAAARLQDLPPWFDLRLQTADAFEFCAQPAEQHRYDLVIAHAFLDLLDIPTALPLFKQLLRPGGLFYFTINFDGASILQPEIDPPYDAAVEAAYHRTMDERITQGKRSGDSRTGRHLFGRLRAAGYHVTAAGSSDWVVFAQEGHYPDQEAYFLHFIVDTMHGALQHDPQVGGAVFERWIAQRHDQIERGELVYIAHQLDFLGHI
jgi:SAM-dependent methyltransferase